LDWKSLAEPIRSLTDKNTTFPWPRSDAGRLTIVRTLSDILPRNDVEQACLGNSNEEMNRNLRMLIAPYFKTADQALISRLAVWIVKQWGGIKRGTDVVPHWCNELSDFSHASIDSFVKKMGNTRISSWSKVVAFASPSTDAIYDARTAVSINCALYSLGIKDGFFMPVGRNKDIVPASIFIMRSGFNSRYGYPEYISLLSAMSEIDGNNDILDLEMILFASAPSVASSFSKSFNK
jgi:hypothetical protein